MEMRVCKSLRGKSKRERSRQERVNCDKCAGCGCVPVCVLVCVGVCVLVCV